MSGSTSEGLMSKMLLAGAREARSKRQLSMTSELARFILKAAYKLTGFFWHLQFKNHRVDTIETSL